MKRIIVSALVLLIFVSMMSFGIQAATYKQFDCCDSNYMISFSDSASEKEKEQVLASITSGAIISSIPEAIERSDARLENEIRQTLPMPIFFLVETTVAFFSISLLNVRKKAREMAVCYLCGSSRKMYTCVASFANRIIQIADGAIISDTYKS